MVRLQIVLDPTEANVLAQWAASEMRDPRDQIRYILYRELERHNLLLASDGEPSGAERRERDEREAVTA